MTDLIKRNYRRRMLWFYINVITWCISMAFTVFAIVTKMPGIIQFGALLITAAIAAPSLICNADSVNLPWVVKKRQLNAIKQFQKADFEDLKFSVPLKEYFEI